MMGWHIFDSTTFQVIEFIGGSGIKGRPNTSLRNIDRMTNPINDYGLTNDESMNITIWFIAVVVTFLKDHCFTIALL